MFFKIRSTVDETFPTHIKLTHHMWMSADDGWKEYIVDKVRVIFKGYIDHTEATDEVLSQIANSKTPIFSGNYTAIVVRYGLITIQHDVYRSFLLQIDDATRTIHNLTEPSTRRVPASCIITVSDRGIVSPYVDFDPIGPIDPQPLSKVEAIDAIDDILLTRFKQFFAHNTLPVKMFVTGGIDTMVCWSYLKQLGIDYELITDQHVFDSLFWQNHSNELQTFWGYTQIHSWEEPVVLVSGALGDEVMMRGPETANWLLKSFGTSIPEQIKPEHYHFMHFTLPKNAAKYESNTGTRDETVAKILDVTINDHQHWHLDNTLTFTPFKDIAITKLLLRLLLDDVVGQVVDAEISKALVARNCPELLECLESHKNKSFYTKTEKDFVQFLKHK